VLQNPWELASCETDTNMLSTLQMWSLRNFEPLPHGPESVAAERHYIESFCHRQVDLVNNTTRLEYRLSIKLQLTNGCGACSIAGAQCPAHSVPMA